MIITIDGPTASGKSTVAEQLAQQLSYYYINSGLLFRAYAYILSQKVLYNCQNIMLLQPEQLDSWVVTESFQYRYNEQKSGALIAYNTDNITPYLKTKKLDYLASCISMHPHVRKHIMNFQRSIAKQHNIVVDGRDAGTVVFPHAEYKFFLTARLAIRVKRWMNEQIKKENTISYAHAEKQVIERDNRDSSRALAPLKVPDDAQIIDNSDMTIFETIQELYCYIVNKQSI